MKTPLETFEDWLSYSGLGRRYHPIPAALAPPFEKQLRTFNQRKSDLRSMYLPGRNIELYADFIDDGVCDAAADIYEYLGVIGVNKGAIMLPLEMFFNMFSNPLVLPELGNSKGERRGPQHGEGLLTDYDDLVFRRKKAGRKISPRDPADPCRQVIAQLCAEVTWSFIMLHEVIHITHGHVDYVKRSLRSSAVPSALKASWKAYSPPGELDLQALELWADNKAISVSLGGFLTESRDPLPFNMFPDPEHKVFIWSFAIYTLFRIWELKTDPANLWGSHPPPGIRFQMAMQGAALTALAKIPGMGENQFHAVVDRGMTEAERAIAYCGGERITPGEAGRLANPSVVSHYNMLLKHFDEVLRSELPKYAYVALKEPVPMQI